MYGINTDDKNEGNRSPGRGNKNNEYNMQELVLINHCVNSVEEALWDPIR